ncbi:MULTISPECIES: ATP-binding protein [Shewanella]|uniref:ATP-binding protein n=1 Tax=Shewanella TaxID=22 RepID=UPI00201A706E|nr:MULTISPECIES: ATP-binding protein [Shewanella]
MLSSVSFQTRARTIDHLGREQIADCPTAISELWKNAYDAYARNVELHIFDGDIPVAALLDDGHGMNRAEFETKWLTVGTESKTNGFDIPEEDRDGLTLRPKQGQKGIGRLSSAALGPLMLIVSKRKNENFVSALIDWRIFENPFLLLQDIQIPVTEFEKASDLIDELPSLFDQMMGNVWGDSNDEKRTARLNDAWDRFTAQEKADGNDKSTKDKIVNTLINDVFSERHLSKWSVWQNISIKGTAMFIADVYDDIKFQISKVPFADAEGPEQLARERFQQTLSNFTDPFSKDDERLITDFCYSVIAWHKTVPSPILDNVNEFDIRNLEDLEHIIEGTVNDEGYFNGRVKVFGEWIEGYQVKPKVAYKTRRDSAFGSFHLRVGTFELQIGSTTLPNELHSKFLDQAEKYGGFRVYRDGLRVMPYGRVDSDYFSIEFRRSKNAGRYFWANRRMFGRIAITRDLNQNLKDKAGREGFIENRASKLFREIVENILTSVADKYFGSKSNLRKPTLENIKEEKAAIKAEEDRKKLISKERARIRNTIKKDSNKLLAHVKEVIELQQSLSSWLDLKSSDEIQIIKAKIDDLASITSGFSLSPIPPNLGRLEDDYREYRKLEIQAQDIIKDLTFRVNIAIKESKGQTDIQKAEEVYRSKLASLNSSITRYAAEGKELLAKQQTEFDSLVKHCREQYKISLMEALEDLKLEKVSLEYVINKLDEEQIKTEIENSQKLSPYITALNRLNEEIDLEGLAIDSMNETLKYREEITRLHALAQLGITVEVIGHEIEGLDMTVTRSLKTISELSTDPRITQANIDALEAQQILSDKWRFLSPLKLSGEKISRTLTGEDIYQYVSKFFKSNFNDKNIQFSASDAFINMSLFDQPSRIYPVFINLVNNSQYWVEHGDSISKQILLDVNGDEVFISDNGPGVDKDDLEQLFTLFFTRKQRGGRGIGLYLCRQNLQASGHKIRYETLQENKLLPGANFAIEFKGMKND